MNACPKITGPPKCLNRSVSVQNPNAKPGSLQAIPKGGSSGHKEMLSAKLIQGN